MVIEAILTAVFLAFGCLCVGALSLGRYTRGRAAEQLWLHSHDRGQS